MNASAAPEPSSESGTPRGRSRGLQAAVAIAIVVVGAILLAVLAPPSQVDDIPAAPSALANPPGSATTVTPAVPAFYQVNAEAVAPAGTVEKSQPIQGAPGNVNAYRFIYHSPDITGQDALVSGMFVAPKGQPPAGGWPLVAFGHGTTGTNQHCGISLTPFVKNTPGYYETIAQILPLVAQGYAVTATDYLGEGAPGTPSYLVGQLEGQNILDSVRAAHNWQPSVNKNKTIIWGHSQGGHSASFAAQIAPTYAPELKIQGAAVLAPGLLPSLPLAVEGLLASEKPSGQTGFVMQIVVSWTQTYPDQVSADDILTPAGLAKLPLVNSLCGEDMSNQFMDYPMSHYVKNPVPAIFYTLATQNTPGLIPIQMPLVMVQGMEDTTIIPQLTLAYAKLLCQKRDTLDFRIYPNDNHSGVVYNSRPFIDQWMNDRFTGQSAPNNCPNQ